MRAGLVGEKERRRGGRRSFASHDKRIELGERDQSGGDKRPPLRRQRTRVITARMRGDLRSPWRLVLVDQDGNDEAMIGPSFTSRWEALTAGLRVAALVGAQVAP